MEDAPAVRERRPPEQHHEQPEGEAGVGRVVLEDFGKIYGECVARGGLAGVQPPLRAVRDDAVTDVGAFVEIVAQLQVGRAVFARVALLQHNAPAFRLQKPDGIVVVVFGRKGRVGVGGVFVQQEVGEHLGGNVRHHAPLLPPVSQRGENRRDNFIFHILFVARRDAAPFLVVRNAQRIEKGVGVGHLPQGRGRKPLGKIMGGKQSVAKEEFAGQGGYRVRHIRDSPDVTVRHGTVRLLLGRGARAAFAETRALPV